MTDIISNTSDRMNSEAIYIKEEQWKMIINPAKIYIYLPNQKPNHRPALGVNFHTSALPGCKSLRARAPLGIAHVKKKIRKKF